MQLVANIPIRGGRRHRVQLPFSLEHDAGKQLDPNDHERRYRHQDERSDSSDHIAAAGIGAIVFSEMGCSRLSFNKDNDVTPKMVRDWKQIPIVLGPMADVFSGFVAYGYDGGGNKYFRMMRGTDGAWDGVHPLSSESAPDYDNFRAQLEQIGENTGGGSHGSNGAFPSCDETLETIRKVWHIDLRRQSRMPSYFEREQHQWFPMLLSSNKHAGARQQLKLEGLSLERAPNDSYDIPWVTSLLMMFSVLVSLTFIKLAFVPATNRHWLRRANGDQDFVNEESALLVDGGTPGTFYMHCTSMKAGIAKK